MIAFLRSRVPELVLCTLCSTGLSFAFFSGFVLEDGFSSSPLLVLLLCLLLTGLLLVFSHTRLLSAIGIVTGALLFGGVVAYMQMNQLLSNETENSLFIALLLTVLTTVLVYLLTLTRWGCLALLLMGGLVHAGCGFLQFPDPVWALLLFAAAGTVLLVYRCSTVFLSRARVGRLKLRSSLLQSGLLALVTLAAALGLFFGLLRPLSLPTQELKLITLLQSMEQLQVMGVSSVREVLSEDMTSDETPDDEKETRDKGDQPDDSSEDSSSHQQDSDEETPDGETSVQPEAGDAVVQSETDYSEIQYSSSHMWLLLLLLIPASIAAAYGLRMLGKRRWEASVKALPPEAAAVNYYRFFLSRLGRAGIRRNERHTLFEFAEYNAVPLGAFDSEDVTFSELTRLYASIVYGGSPLSKEELRRFELYYSHFYKNLRQEVGPVKYYLTAFRF